VTKVEFRDRSARAPGGDFRLVLGESDQAREIARLKKLKELCRRLARRGEWGVLAAIKRRETTPEHVARLVDQHGIADYRGHLELVVAVGAPTLEVHAETWITTLAESGRGTRRAYTRNIGELVASEVDGHRLGALAWHEIHAHHIVDARARAQARGLARNTLRAMVTAWGSFFTWALKREESEAAAQKRPPVRTTNPVRKAEIWTKAEVTRHRFLNREEFDRLLEVSPALMRAQYATLTLCGLRIEELMVLPPAHMRLPTHIHIGPWGSWAPKGWPRYEHGVRDVPIHRGRLLPLLEEYAETWAGDATFFVNPNTGERWSYRAFCERFRKDVEAAGMVYGQRRGGERQPEGVTPHALRHTLASWMAQDDTQLMKIAKVLGDSEPTVRRIYAHLLPSDLDQSINRLLR
jgi:site-specific recombinase XerC